MTNSGEFLRIFISLILCDFVVRTAYLAGKSPVLPIFADSLGMSAAVLGLIVSVSTATGFFIKPLVGFVSDRTGFWIWMIVGAALFTTMPWLYGFVETSGDLIALRVAHGLATAIYGPVTLAVVAGIGGHQKAETFGWFGLARSGAGIFGPFLGGLMLAYMSPVVFYGLTGVVAALAFVPLFYLRAKTPLFKPEKSKRRQPLRFAAREAISLIAGNKTLRIIAIVEMNFYVGIYALKAHVPLMMLASGRNFVEMGLLLSVQELANAVLRPMMGRIADRAGYMATIIPGLLMISAGLFALPLSLSSNYIFAVAIVIGAGQAAFGPAALALVAETIAGEHRGAMFGVMGSLRNAGKIAGPVVAGVMITAMNAHIAFTILACIPLAIAIWGILRFERSWRALFSPGQSPYQRGRIADNYRRVRSGTDQY